MCIEDIPSVPCLYGQHRLVDFRGNQFSELVPRLVKDVAAWVKANKRPKYCSNTASKVRFDLKRPGYFFPFGLTFLYICLLIELNFRLPYLILRKCLKSERKRCMTHII